jgi:hypothetical protein
MIYIRPKLSNDDKVILDKIYNELEDITIPTSYRKNSKSGSFHSIKTGVTSQKDARQTSFGITKHRGKKQTTSSTKKYPYMMPLFKEFIDSHYPGFKFNSVYVNKNTIAKKHLDSKNTGESLLVGFGAYTEGKTVLYDSNGKENKFSIKSHSLIFNGSEIEHKSESFNGIRYSLVFYLC